MPAWPVIPATSEDGERFGLESLALSRLAWYPFAGGEPVETATPKCPMNWRLPMALSVLMLAMVFLAPLSAQMRGMRAAAPAPRTPASFRAGGRTGFGSRGRGRLGFFPRSRFFTGWAFLPPPFYPDFDYDYDYYYDYAPEATQASPTWLVPTQAEQPPAPAKPIEPLVLERHGDEWVRIRGYSQSTAPAQSTKPSAEQAPNPPSETTGQNIASQPAAKLPPAVLVFRDGHQEEIERYTIVGPSFTYARIIGALGRGQERSRLPIWTFPPR